MHCMWLTESGHIWIDGRILTHLQTCSKDRVLLWRVVRFYFPTLVVLALRGGFRVGDQNHSDHMTGGVFWQAVSWFSLQQVVGGAERSGGQSTERGQCLSYLVHSTWRPRGPAPQGPKTQWHQQSLADAGSYVVFQTPNTDRCWWPLMETVETELKGPTHSKVTLKCM